MYVEILICSAFTALSSTICYMLGLRHGTKQSRKTFEAVKKKAITQIVEAIVRIEEFYKDQRTAHKVYLINVTAALHELVPDKFMRDTLLSTERKSKGVKNPCDTSEQWIPQREKMHIANAKHQEQAITMIDKISLVELMQKSATPPVKQVKIAHHAPAPSPTPQLATMTLPAPDGYSDTLHRRIAPHKDSDKE